MQHDRLHRKAAKLKLSFRKTRQSQLLRY